MRILWGGEGKALQLLRGQGSELSAVDRRGGLGTEPSGKVDNLHWGKGRFRRDEKLGVWGHVYFLLT